MIGCLILKDLKKMNKKLAMLLATASFSSVIISPALVFAEETEVLVQNEKTEKELIESDNLDMSDEEFLNVEEEKEVQASSSEESEGLEQIENLDPHIEENSKDNQTTNIDVPEDDVFSLEKNREMAIQVMEEELGNKENRMFMRALTVPHTTVFINSVAPSAIKNGKIYGLYPSVIIAQSILESGWGKSSLSGDPNYNLFGIKAEKGYTGDYVKVPTEEWEPDASYKDGGYFVTIYDNFRKYSSYDETFKDHANFLKKTRYTNVWIQNAATYQDATAALQAAGYATDPQYAIKLNSIIKSYNLTQYDPVPSVAYSTHVQDIGTLNYVANGVTGGTVGKNKQMEAIKIKIDNLPGLGVEYSSHIQNIGWANWVSNNQLSGTQGQSKQMEAIKIQLNGLKAKLYDVYYRVHAENHGWLDWAKNGQSAGTVGYGKQLEAIEIKVVKKGEVVPGPTIRPYIEKIKIPTVLYSSHVEDKGWQTTVKNGQLSGTEGKNKQLEAVKIAVEGVDGLEIKYTSHVQDYGWMSEVKNNQVSGTTGKAKQLEALKINLAGSKAGLYDVYYRVHVADIGWLDWAKNGQEAGTTGLAKQLEAFEIKIVKKGSPAPGSTTKYFLTK